MKFPENYLEIKIEYFKKCFTFGIKLEIDFELFLWRLMWENSVCPNLAQMYITQKIIKIFVAETTIQYYRLFSQGV